MSLYVSNCFATPYGVSCMVEAPDGNTTFIGSSLAIQRLPTEPIGTFTLTLTNLIAGSAIQVEDQAGTTTFYNGVAAGTSQAISLQAYSAGSPRNDLRIKVRKATNSPYYKPWDTQATAIVGSQSIYVAQISDE